MRHFGICKPWTLPSPALWPAALAVCVLCSVFPGGSYSNWNLPNLSPTVLAIPEFWFHRHLSQTTTAVKEEIILFPHFPFPVALSCLHNSPFCWQNIYVWHDDLTTVNLSELPTHLFLSGQVNINPIISPTSKTPHQKQKSVCWHKGECGTKAGMHNSGQTAYTSSSGGRAGLKHPWTMALVRQKSGCSLLCVPL